MPSERVKLAPSLSSFLASLKSRPIDASVELLAVLLKSRHIRGSRDSSFATANLLINVVAAHKPLDSNELLQSVSKVGARLAQAQPNELAVGNVVRRVLGLIRDAVESNKRDVGAATPTLNGVLSNAGTPPPMESTAKEDVLDGIRELLDELDQAEKQIAEYAHEHIFPEETVLIIGGSSTVQKFLLDAAKRRKFRVLYVEGYPKEHTRAHDTLLQGAVRFSDELSSNQNRLKTLVAAGLSVMVTPDTQVFAMMPLVSKVVMAAQGIFSNGGCTVTCGSKGLASIAKLHRVPVVVLGAIYRLSPSFPFDTAHLVESGNPAVSMSFQHGQMMTEVATCSFDLDYVPPELVSLFVTNIGGCPPNQAYRLAADHYRSQDTGL